MLKSFFISLLLLSISCLSAQNKAYNHEIFSKKEGVELNNVKTMLLDNEGFLWIAGESLKIRTIINSNHKLGIQRFNGSSFHTFYLPIYDNPITAVNQLYLREDGKIYVLGKKTLNESILFLFDPIKIEFTEVKIPNPKNEKVTLSKIFKYNEKDYILTHYRGKTTLNILEANLTFKKQFSFLVPDEKVLSSNSVFIPFNKHCLIGDKNFGLFFYDWNGKLLKKVDVLIEPKNATRASNKYKYIDKHFTVDTINYITFFDEAKVYRINEKNLSLVPESIKSPLKNNDIEFAKDSFGNSYAFIQEDGNSSLWFINKNKFEKKLTIPNVNAKGIARFISNDFNKEVWFTNQGKLHHIIYVSTTIKSFLSEIQIRAIYRFNKEKVLIASQDKGWFLFDLTTEKISEFQIKEDEVPLIPISSRNIISIDDKLWSNNYSYILEINPLNRKVISYRHYPILCLEKSTDSTLIYGTNNYHLMAFNTKTKKHSKLIKTDTLKIFDIAIKDKLLVAATDKGILSYNLNSKKVNFYKDKLKDNFYLMVDYKEDYGFLLGSRSGRIVQYQPNLEQFNIIYRDDYESGIATIIQNEETLWINTFKGLVAFNTKTKEKNRYSERDGLSNNEGNRYSALKTENHIFMGSLKGLNYFNPEKLKPREINSQITLLKIRKYNVEENKILDHYNRTEFKNNTTITLPAEHKDLELDFAIKNNTNNKESRFEYRLNKNEWVDLKNKNSIHFPNLAVGNYALEIRALDFSNKKIGKSLKLFIKSKNFFYKTPVFITAFFLGLISILLYIIYQGRSKKIMQEQFSHEILISREKERSKIAKDLHDGVGQQLTLIKKYAQKEEQPKFSELTNNVLEEVRSISRGLYPSVLKQLGLTDSLEQLILDCDEKTSIFFTYNLTPIDDKFDKDKTIHLYRFVQEVLSNILKHSEATSVKISVEKETKKVKILIKDNGKGFDLNLKTHKNSLGLKTLNERIKLLKGNLEIKSKLKQGTLIIVEIPVI